MRLKILLAILFLVFNSGCLFMCYNEGFDDGYVLGMIAQGLGMDSFENYDMPYDSKDNHKKKW